MQLFMQILLCYLLSLINYLRRTAILIYSFSNVESKLDNACQKFALYSNVKQIATIYKLITFRIFFVLVTTSLYIIPFHETVKPLPFLSLKI